MNGPALTSLVNYDAVGLLIWPRECGQSETQDREGAMIYLSDYIP